MRRKILTIGDGGEEVMEDRRLRMSEGGGGGAESGDQRRSQKV